jgi:3-carboxy-cis,cis-muconate cycloisomerase
MNLFDPLFRWPVITNLFTDEALLQSMLDFEAALARAELAAGIVPASAVSAITSKCRAELFDRNQLGKAAALAGNLAITLVKQLKSLVAAENKDAANFVHWGATSQDVIDTATILQLQRAFALIAKEIAHLSDSLATLANKHRATPIVGRTWMQHAVPTTLGFKFAASLDALNRHSERLRETEKRCLVLQFGGAVGTLAALGTRGQVVAKALSDELKLPQPQVPWHSHRDRIAEVATNLGLLTGTLGKIAHDIALHSQTEIDELREPAEEGRGGSSTMPHKQNPVACAATLSAAARVPGLVSTMLTAMLQEDERGLGNWHAEWETLPEIVTLSAGALHHLTDLIPHLEINSDRMLKNLELTNGLIYSEALTAALASKIGHSEARSRVDAATQQAAKEHHHLRTIIEQDKYLAHHLSTAELDQLFDPGHYTGMANVFIDQVLAQHQSQKSAHPKK